MNTNKPKLKTQRKTRLNILLSQTLTMNAAHDIKILEYWICIYSLVEGVFKKCFLESKILPSINRYPIYKEKRHSGKKQKKNKNKIKEIFNGEKSINGLSKRIVALSQNITF